MYNQPFFIPSYQVTSNALRGRGLLSRIMPIFRNMRNIKWTELINNTSKTLGIINQTIPVVRQVGPMVGNLKSMMKIASVFNDVTDAPKKSNNVNNRQRNDFKSNNTYNTKNSIASNNDDYSPTFFINS